jgi:aminopeptidase-like protein
MYASGAASSSFLFPTSSSIPSRPIDEFDYAGHMEHLRVAETIAEQVPAMGTRIHGLVSELYPILRSITGEGLRTTVRRLSRIVPLEITEVPTGTPVFDWTVPDEWTISEAYIEHESGRRYADMRDSSLHVMGYSTPVDATMSLSELKPHLHSVPELPDHIPFRTSFFARSWGFCLADRELQTLPDGQYRVVIRSTLAKGSLTLAEFVHRGATDEEVLVFAHDCHPALANDNLSAVSVAIHLAAFIATQKTRYTYRFVFAPTTIGSITWLATREAVLGRIRHGLVLALLGHGGPLHYKRSRTGDCPIDRAASHVLHTEFKGAQMVDFCPWGHDERQFGSPGINLAVGSLTRSPAGDFPGSHTSADGPSLLSTEALGEAWWACLKIIEALEADACYVNLRPKGEPELGRRGLYRLTGGYYTNIADRQMAFLWLLNQSDGATSLVDIAVKSGLPVALLDCAAAELVAAGLLGRVARAEPASQQLCSHA